MLTQELHSVFHSEYCEELGIDLTSGKRVDITVGDGGIIPVYIYQLKVRIGDLETVSKIGFSDRLGIGIPILGREDILDKYLICFDGKNREVIWHK